jgi:hypothetical protein
MDRDQVEAPGPGSYKRHAAVGVQVESTKSSLPSYSLRGRETFGSTFDVERAKNDPGPGQYKINVNPQRERFPVHSFPRSAQRRTRRQDKTPGPGSYKAQSSIGKQTNSKNRIDPSFSFRRAPRDERSREGDAGEPIESSASTILTFPPTVKNYVRVNAFGSQKDSTRQSMPSWKFGTGLREREQRARKQPGPGQYKSPQACGRQGSSKKKTAPSCTFGSRQKFGSPYGRFPVRTFMFFPCYLPSLLTTFSQNSFK